MAKYFKNPMVNALLAEVYIICIVLLIQIFTKSGIEDTILIPMVMLSLFVLSASIMGYLFLGEPIQLYLNGEKSQAVTFFMKTVGTFSVLVVILVSMLLVLFA